MRIFKLLSPVLLVVLLVTGVLPVGAQECTDAQLEQMSRFDHQADYTFSKINVTEVPPGFGIAVGFETNIFRAGTIQWYWLSVVVKTSETTATYFIFNDLTDVEKAPDVQNWVLTEGRYITRAGKVYTYRILRTPNEEPRCSDWN